MSLDDQKRIMFVSYFGAWPIHTQVDAMLGKALSVRGNDVAVVRCKGLLRKEVEGGPKSDCGLPYDCEFCVGFGDKFFNNLTLPQKDIADYISKADIDGFVEWLAQTDFTDLINVTYKGMRLGEWVMPQIMTSLRIRFSDMGHPGVKTLAQTLVFNAFLSYVAIERIMTDWRPDHAIFFSGRFTPYRTAVRAVEKLGIPYMVHERAWFGRGFLFYDNDYIPHMVPFRKMAETWAKIPLKLPEIEVANDILVNKRYGKYGQAGNFYTDPDVCDDSAYIRHQLGIPQDVKLIGCFTSSEEENWDFEEPNAGSLQPPLLENLIELMRERSEWLVIRHHPNIAGRKGGNAEGFLLELLYGQTRSLPPNVRVIMPNEEVTSYDLLSALDGAMALFSTFGLELAAQGVPFIAHRQSPLLAIAPSICMDSVEKHDLAKAIDAVLKIDGDAIEKDMAIALRFNYYALHKHGYLFKSFCIANDWQYELNISGIEDFLPGADPVLDHVCDHFMYGSPLYYYPTLEDRQRSDEIERAFVHEKYQQILERRANTKKRPIEKLPAVTVIHLTKASDVLVSNRHPDLNYVICDPSNGVRLALEGFDVTHQEADFFAILLPNSTYDLTALHSTAAKLIESPENTVALLSSWAYTPHTIGLFRLSADVDGIESLRRNLPDDQYIDLVLSRLVWTRAAFERFQTLLKENPERSFKACLDEVIDQYPLLRIERPRLMTWR